MVALAHKEQSGETRFAPFPYEENGDQSMRGLAIANIQHARSLGLPQIEKIEPQDRKCLIVARGPSILEHKDKIIQAKKDGAYIFAVNNAHDWLTDIGVIPDGFVIFEVGAYVPLAYIKRHKDVTYFIASHCHPANFEWANGFKRVVWHCINDWPGADEEIAKFGPGAFMIGGGNTTVMRVVNIALILGFRELEMYGVESSFTDKSHAIGPLREDETITVIASGHDGFKAFKTLPYLARQADEFRRWYSAFHKMIDLKVYGEGLLPYLQRSIDQTKEA